ncbi:MAG: DUF1080 domain-containing protein [Verrucomicrobiales bacterium]
MRVVPTSLFVTAACCFGVLAADDEGRRLFDGESLDGWKAPEMSYWSVEDGAITATSSAENPAAANQFLVWQGGEVDDFVLTLRFRVEGGPKANSGVQIRSRVEDDGHAVGYQIDISQPEAPWLGAIYDEHGRKMLAERGEKTVVKRDGTFEKKSLAESGEAAIASYTAGEWNDYEITARGNRISVKLNGHRTAEVVDRQEAERELSGVLALQLHSGPPMKVQFKDIVLKPLKEN